MLAVDLGVRLRAEKAVVGATTNLVGRHARARRGTLGGLHRDLTRLLHAVAVGRAGIVDDRAGFAGRRASTGLHRRTGHAHERAAREAARLRIRIGGERLGAGGSLRPDRTLNATVVAFERVEARRAALACAVLAAAIAGYARAAHARPERRARGA